MQMLEENQLVKKFSEAKRTCEAERESQAQQVATAQARLSKKESEVYGKSEEVNRQRAEQEATEEEVRKSNPAWLADGFDFVAKTAEAEREAEEARGGGDDVFMAGFLEKVIDNAGRKGKCGVCDQQCAEPQIEHMRKKQKKYADKESVSPEERTERTRQKSELAR